jgi:hypothetical protein
VLDSSSHRRDNRDRDHLYHPVLTSIRSDSTSVGHTELDDMYNTFGIIVAALFGLTPNLFINILQDKAKGLTDQLQKSSASEQGKTGS